MGRLIKIVPILLLVCCLCSCGQQNSIVEEPVSDNTESMELEYAEQFNVDYLENGCYEITIMSDKFLLVPENVEGYNADESVTVIKQPVENIYLGASSAMDLFYGIECIDSIKFTATKQSDWSMDYIKEKIGNDIIYAGKYSSPDYEILLSEGCGLAIESTMIYHSPEVKEQLELLGIPVLTERSSYENHPLGRLEWIKLYGLICNCEDEAEKFFEEKKSLVESIELPEENKTVAFFSINPNGYVTVHKPGDYISRMIELAGGNYIFNSTDIDVGDNSLSTINMQFELFYEKAKEADIIIYNSTIDGVINTREELLSKNSMLADFKAFETGDVWCTEKNMFQQTTCMAEMIIDINKAVSGTDENVLEFLHRLE